MNILTKRPHYCVLLCLLFWLPTSALAGDLVIQGTDQTVTLSQQTLLELGEEPLTTHTPWTDGEQVFAGASLAKVLAQAGIENGELEAVALNGYSVDIPVKAAIDAGAFVAAQANGELMRVKDKGPFWIVFPWTDDPDLVNREIRNWAIWQLTRLAVME